jgi:preprotein translocase subunit SecE
MLFRQISEKQNSLSFNKRENSVTSMLKELKWPTLQQRRTNTKMVMMYRIVHHLIAISLQKYLTPATTRTTRGHDLQLKL